MLRGVNRQRIFEESADYQQFLYYLLDIKNSSGFKLLAYCLMNNHVHLLIKEDSGSLSLIFKNLGTRYASWFNKKYDRCGHLFQDRFKSIPVESDAYFIQVLIYIYQNPVKDGFCAQSQDYRWSSRKLLGTGRIIDENELFSIVPCSSILEKELFEHVVELPKQKTGRKLVISDDEVFFRMKRLSDTKNTSEFQMLDSEAQAEVFRALRGHGVSIRQFARVSGLGRGLVQSW